MTKDYNQRRSLSKQFPLIREVDRENLKTVLDALHEQGFHVRMAGSALERADYNDIDLGAWDKRNADIGAKPVESLLEKLGVTKFEKLYVPATYIHGWVRFDYQGTNFDIVCASDKYYLQYL